MGRSVSRPSNAVACAIKNVSYMGYEWNEETEEYGDDFDEDTCRFEWEYFVENIVDQAQEKWKSLEDVSGDNKWAGSEDRVLLENSMCQIGVSEYCGCANVWLRSLEDDDYTDDKLRNLSPRWCESISNNFMKLFAEYVKVGSMSNGEGVFEKYIA